MVKAHFLVCSIIMSQFLQGGFSSEISPNKDSPNIVILFADNLAYANVIIFADVDSQNSKTPYLDGLTVQGIMFHKWNSAAHLCSTSHVRS